MLLRRAGLDVPAAQQVEALSIELRSADFLSAERQKAILDADVNHSLDVLGPVWPDLPRLVARRLNKIVTAVQRDRCSARYRLAYGRDRDAIPPTPVLLWEWELFVTVLHEQLNGLSSRLWLTGSWTPNYERELLADIVPDTAVHLGLAASRTVRPVWPDPASASTGTGSLPTVGDDDPLFVRWTRLAIVESQFVHDPERRYGPPTECVRLFAGAIAVPIGDVVPSGAFPFEDAEAHDWWQPLTTPPVIPPRLQPGCLVRLGRKTDWLGDDHILVPPFELRTYLDLQPPGYRAPLVWSDRNGAPAIVLRSWRVRNAEAFDSEPADYEGVDLIARPDVVERLGTLCAMPLRELRVIDRRPIHQE
jgi:hypothetical protein